jgi:peptidoglycan hydrolase-like protein with peptidoglycan-binding domain
VADEPDLEPGASSEWVSYLQQMLNHHYQQTVVEENGWFDDATASAVLHFRQQSGLPESSTVDSEFWDALLGR